MGCGSSPAAPHTVFKPQQDFSLRKQSSVIKECRITRSGEPHMCIFLVLLQPYRLVHVAFTSQLGWAHGTPRKTNPTVSLVVQFDPFPEASWAGFWLPGGSWAGFLAPKSRPWGRAGTPPIKQTLQSIQLFSLISFLEPPGLGFLALGIFVWVLVEFWFSSGFGWFCFGSVLVHKQCR